MELQDIITAEQLRQDQDEVFADVLASATPKVIIYEGQPSLVLIGAESYQAQVTRLAILAKMIAGRKDVEAGRVISNDQVIAELQERINTAWLRRSIDGKSTSVLGRISPRRSIRSGRRDVLPNSI
jgi:PHD/YefM family antitoxin component YafN of YafNO toxin-antitoxin module